MCYPSAVLQGCARWRTASNSSTPAVTETFSDDDIGDIPF